jgi:6-phosphogluconolactonase
MLTTRRSIALGFALASCLAAGCGGGGSSRKDLVFAMTNSAAGNEVIVFGVDDDGRLARIGAASTGGDGTGIDEVSSASPQDGIAPLASQGALVVTLDGRRLFAVNAGSDTIASLDVDDDGGLTLIDVAPSGGVQPNSVAFFADLLYVSNVGDETNAFSSNVTGFRVEPDGVLDRLPDSTRTLSTPMAQPASVAFESDGRVLVVTELTTDRLSVFPVDGSGLLGAPVVEDSSGPAPSGAVFLSNGQLLVAEAPRAELGALSSYLVDATNQIDGTRRLQPVSLSVPNGQVETCCVAHTLDERFAYTSNTTSGSISSYAVEPDGTLTIRDSQASLLEGTASGPIDLAVSRDGRYLYVLDGAIGTITAHRIESDGRLTRLQAITDPDLPTRGAQGLAVR